MSLSPVSFEQLVTKHGNDRNAKRFTSKAQLVTMIFSHLARADSLSEITNGFLCCNGKVKHLGIKAAPKRSTLAYANEHRSADLYEEYFWKQLQHFRTRNMLEKSGKISREKLFEYYSKAILIFPSFIESYPLPLIEAMLHRTPVIASDQPFGREILRSYEKVSFYKNNEIKVLVMLLKKYLFRHDNNLNK